MSKMPHLPRPAGDAAVHQAHQDGAAEVGSLWQRMVDDRKDNVIGVIRDIKRIRLAVPMCNLFTILSAVTLVLIIGISCEGLLSDKPDNQPPVVRVISPLDGATVYSDTIAVCLHILDESPICQISYFIDGNKRVKVYLAVSDPNKPTNKTWEMSFTVSAGEHLFYGEVEDCHGNLGRSASITATFFN